MSSFSCQSFYRFSAGPCLRCLSSFSRQFFSRFSTPRGLQHSLNFSQHFLFFEDILQVHDWGACQIYLDNFFPDFPQVCAWDVCRFFLENFCIKIFAGHHLRCLLRFSQQFCFSKFSAESSGVFPSNFHFKIFCRCAPETSVEIFSITFFLKI